MKRLSIYLLVGSALMLAIAAYLFIFTFGEWLPFDASGSVWAVLAALGTLGATGVALWLAVRAMLQEGDAAARLVSAWVTDDYVSQDGESSYTRVVKVHVANEGNEPVFDAHISVVVSQPDLALGPLSVPTPLAVLPPRRSRSFDISQPLRAHNDTWNPRVELAFSDSRGRRWLRDSSGQLSKTTDLQARWEEAVNDERQIGSDSLENPMLVAMTFLAALGAEERVREEGLLATLAPEAKGWVGADWGSLSQEYADWAPTSMVDYPAPYIARVKIVGNPELQGKQVVGERMEISVQFLTLTYAPSRGWRVWGLGGTVPPDRILFPAGTFG
jgi:hypothetical protein